MTLEVRNQEEKIILEDGLLCLLTNCKMEMSSKEAAGTYSPAEDARYMRTLETISDLLIKLEHLK